MGYTYLNSCNFSSYCTFCRIQHEKTKQTGNHGATKEKEIQANKPNRTKPNQTKPNQSNKEKTEQPKKAKVKTANEPKKAGRNPNDEMLFDHFGDLSKYKARHGMMRVHCTNAGNKQPLADLGRITSGGEFCHLGRIFNKHDHECACKEGH
jgi:hypothetical protein